MRSERRRRYCFKGLTLVNHLLEHDPDKFATRQRAIHFGQTLVDRGTIAPLTPLSNASADTVIFEDSATLYRWRDSGLIHEARRISSEQRQRRKSADDSSDDENESRRRERGTSPATADAAKAAMTDTGFESGSAGSSPQDSSLICFHFGRGKDGGSNGDLRREPLPGTPTSDKSDGTNIEAAEHVSPPPGLTDTGQSCSPSSCAAPLAPPRKAVVQPRRRMPPLLWHKLQLCREKTFWHDAREVPLDTDEFERLFGAAESEQRASVHVLSPQRRRQVSSRMAHFEAYDVEAALHAMHGLSIEQLECLDELQATPAELSQLLRVSSSHPRERLAAPEQFLLRLSRVDQLSLRVQGCLFRQRSEQHLASIHRQLKRVARAASVLRHNRAVRQLLCVVLSLGNHMNGGTCYGQADAFDLRILPRLRDIRSSDDELSLLQYALRLQRRLHPDSALPASSILRAGAEVDIRDMAAQLRAIDVEMSRVRSMVECAHDVGESLWAATQQLLDEVKLRWDAEDVYLQRTTTQLHLVGQLFGFPAQRDVHTAHRDLLNTMAAFCEHIQPEATAHGALHVQVDGLVSSEVLLRRHEQCVLHCAASRPLQGHCAPATHLAPLAESTCSSVSATPLRTVSSLLSRAARCRHPLAIPSRMSTPAVPRNKLLREAVSVSNLLASGQ